jgi:hypothetical protein
MPSSWTESETPVGQTENAVQIFCVRLGQVVIGLKHPFLAASLISAPDYFDECHFLLE